MKNNFKKDQHSHFGDVRRTFRVRRLRYRREGVLSEAVEHGGCAGTLVRAPRRIRTRHHDDEQSRSETPRRHTRSVFQWQPREYVQTALSPVHTSDADDPPVAAGTKCHADVPADRFILRYVAPTMSRCRVAGD